MCLHKFLDYSSSRKEVLHEDVYLLDLLSIGVLVVSIMSTLPGGSDEQLAQELVVNDFQVDPTIAYHAIITPQYHL
jgi:hypothetical protein